MKVLWLGGIPLPRIAIAEKMEVVPINGWLVNLSDRLQSEENVELTYVFDSNRYIANRNEFYNYYGIPCKQSSASRFGDEYINQAVDILRKENPDIIHIWGTEYAHSLAMVEACERLGIVHRVVISIQGIVSKCYYHYSAFLPEHIMQRYTFRDLLKGNLAKAKKNFQLRGKLEEEAIARAHHVIGRTEWDRASVWDINPTAQYHFNNETLREEFYTGSWSHEKCEIHSIFCSQANYPIKGVHLMIQALPRILKEYPDTHLYIGGRDYFQMPFWKQSSYGKYLVELTKKYNLWDHISFTGFLNAEQMKTMYLKTNVFVSASSIENSPNSLGEAMILGVPCVASRVGGVHSLLKHNEEGFLYPADETYMLSYYICVLFDDVEKATRFGQKAHGHAIKTHSSEDNRKQLMEIYREVICEKQTHF